LGEGAGKSPLGREYRAAETRNGDSQWTSMKVTGICTRRQLWRIGGGTEGMIPLLSKWCSASPSAPQWLPLTSVFSLGPSHMYGCRSAVCRKRARRSKVELTSVNAALVVDLRSLPVPRPVFLCRQRFGLSPVVRRNTRHRWDWSYKPHSSAI
jgi:hypothetical protein